MTLERREPLTKIGVLLMTIGLGVFLGGLLGACSGGSPAVESENKTTKDIPLLDEQQPSEVKTASFALG